MFDINNSFYQDICSPYETENGTDILLSDRIDYIYNNENTKCQSNCHFSNYSLESKYLVCTCSSNEEAIKENNEEKDKFKAKTLSEGFIEVWKNSNYKILKCINAIMSVDLVSKNVGSFAVIIYFLVHMVSLYFAISNGISPLQTKLKYQLKDDIEKNHLKIKINIEELFYPPKKNKHIRKLVLRKETEIKKPVKVNRRNVNAKTQVQKYNKANLEVQNISSENSLNPDLATIEKKGELKRRKTRELKEDLKEEKKRKSKLYNKEIIHSKKNMIQKVQKNIDYSDLELNELEYEEAIQLDKRTFPQLYWATIQREHIIFYIFVKCNDFSLLSIKLIRLIFLIVTNMALNAFLFSDDSIHKLFVDHGKYDFIRQIPKIFYSIVFSELIELFLCYLSLTDRPMYRIKSYVLKNDANKIEEEFKCMKIKLTMYYLFTTIFFALYWYIISVFCGVYTNTQIAFIKDSAISFSICLIYPFIIYFFSNSLRICALRDSKKRLKCIYKLGNIIPFF